MKIVLGIVCILVAVLLIAWLGLQVKPKSFAPYTNESPELETIWLC